MPTPNLNKLPEDVAKALIDSCPDTLFRTPEPLIPTTPKTPAASEYIDLNQAFIYAASLGELPKLSAWDEVELYRKFNDGHLPNLTGMAPTHVEYAKDLCSRASIFSRAACRALAYFTIPWWRLRRT